MAGSVVFFIDKCLVGEKIRKGIRNSHKPRLKVEPLENHFPEDCKDADWIPVVSSRDWVIVTKDHRILSNPVELGAIYMSRARVVMFTDNDLSADDMIGLFQQHISEILKIIEERERPFIIVLHERRVQVLPDLDTDHTCH